LDRAVVLLLMMSELLLVPAGASHAKGIVLEKM
jgi:hypothetical protein